MTFDQYGDVSTPFVGWIIEKNDFVAKKNITAKRSPIPSADRNLRGR